MRSGTDPDTRAVDARIKTAAAVTMRLGDGLDALLVIEVRDNVLDLVTLRE